MFKQQLIAETMPSHWKQPVGESLNDSDSIRRLLEQSLGYKQFRIALAGRVTWEATAGAGGGAMTQRDSTLEEAIMAYLPEDRSRVVDAITEAITNRKGFRITARMSSPNGSVRVIESIGDVRVEDGKVIEIFGVGRDITMDVEREAVALSRAKLIREMIEAMPVPVVVLDRSLRVVGCTREWVEHYGIESQKAAVGQPLGRLIDARGALTDGITQAINGKTVRVTLEFYAAEDNREVKRTCTVMPWESGAPGSGGVLMIYGSGAPAYASMDIADRMLGRSQSGLLKLLELM